MFALLALAMAFTQARAAEPVPVGDFFRRPAATSVTLAPSGQYVAVTIPGAGKHQVLSILNLRDLAQSKVIAAFDDVDIVGVAWVNDDRLVFSVADRWLPDVQQRASGLFVVPRDGSVAPIRLIKGSREFITRRKLGGVEHELSVFHRLAAVLRDGSNDVVVEREDVDSSGEPAGSVLLRLDTLNRTTTSLVEGAPDFAEHWAIDSAGRARAVISESKGRQRLYLKQTPNGPWTLNREYDAMDDQGRKIIPIHVSSDGVLFAIGLDPKGGNTSALLRIDIAHPEVPGKVLFSLDGFDFSGSLIHGPGDQLLGIRYVADAQGTYWFDARLKKIQADVDAQLPGMVNRLDCGLCGSLDNVLVGSSSDRQPEIAYLYEPKSNKLTKVIASRPWIDARTMATRDFQKFQARDGLTIPTFVTRPAGSTGPAPMVMLVHGGPYLRHGVWAWDPIAQFLASRGYVVVEPEFRGSTGFGSKLFRAGWKQWGLAMQDDIADAARWAVKQGYADPKRICIAGASYGGYATLMGLVRDPDLYRCGFEWSGVTDIDLLYSITWSDASDEYKNYGMPILVGDRVKDARQLADTSPLKQAARITQPLLIAHGGEDHRVPIDHFASFRNAVREHNPNVESIEYPLEGHGWRLEATDLDFWPKVERFLDKNLKNAP